MLCGDAGEYVLCLFNLAPEPVETHISPSSLPRAQWRDILGSTAADTRTDTLHISLGAHGFAFLMQI